MGECERCGSTGAPDDGPVEARLCDRCRETYGCAKCWWTNNDELMLCPRHNEENVARLEAEVERLRAENAELRAICDDSWLREVEKERDELRAKLADANEAAFHVEHTTVDRFEHDALRAEVERLQDELHHVNGVADLAIKHRDSAEAKVERLRGEIHQLKSDIVTDTSVNLDLCSEVERLRHQLSTSRQDSFNRAKEIERLRAVLRETMDEAVSIWLSDPSFIRCPGDNDPEWLVRAKEALGE